MEVQAQLQVEGLSVLWDLHLIIFQLKTSLKKKLGAHFLEEMDKGFQLEPNQTVVFIKAIIFHLQSLG